jgi:hypothetical protein
MKRPVRLRKAVRRLEAQAVKQGETAERPLPPKPKGMGWRDYLIKLLHIGAELEHSLMVQYLYAAYSLNDQAGSARQRQKVREWRHLLLTVAKEEMGHLLTVQNLLCLLGGPVCFDRSHFPVDTPYLPFPFRLEPVSARSLAWYVYAEAPQDWQVLLRTHSRNRRTKVDQDLKLVDSLVGDAVVAGHAHTVGQLYDEITRVITNPAHIPDSDFRADTYAHQASWDDWGRGYAPPPARPGETEPPPVAVAQRSNVLILQMATRTEAIAALREIGGQGEVPHLKLKRSDEPSHFDRLLELLNDFEAEGRSWNVVHKVPVNPTTLSSRDQPAGSTRIEQKTSLLWATLFNYRYRALLTYLSHTFRLARLVDTQQPNVRGAVMHKIFGEMYHLKALAGILVQWPLKNSPTSGRAVARGTAADRLPEDTPCAAPPFEMPYTLDLPLDEPDCWRRHQDILTSSLEICEALLAGKDPQARELTADEVNYLRTLKQLDQQSIAWMESIIGGLLRTGGHHP